MTAKEWLERAKGINREIEELREEKERAFVAAMGVVRPSDGEKVQTSKTNSQEKLMINYTSYSAELDRRMAELYAVKAEVMEAISKINDRNMRAILFERYLKCKKWNDIALNMGYTLRQIHRIHENALEKIKDVTKCH